MIEFNDSYRGLRYFSDWENGNWLPHWFAFRTKWQRPDYYTLVMAFKAYGLAMGRYP